MPQWIIDTYRMVLKYKCPTNKIFVDDKGAYYGGYFDKRAKIFGGLSDDPDLQEYINELRKATKL